MTIDEILKHYSDKHFKSRLKNKILPRLMDGNVSFDEDIFDRIEKIKNLGKDASSRYAFQLRFGDKWEAEWNKKTEKCKITTHKMTEKYGEQKAKQIAKSKSCGKKDTYINKYGEIEGKKRWEQYLQKRRNTYAKNSSEGKYNNKGTLQYFISRHGEAKGLLMYNNAVERLLKSQGIKSAPAISLFQEIEKHIKDIEYYPNERILDTKNENKYKADCYYRGKVIEFFGDYFHANPQIYNEEADINTFKGHIKAKEIWLRDKQRLDIIKKHYKVLVIWQQDYMNNPKETIKQCIHFLKTK